MGSSNLYPPIIDTYMPAFLKNQTCRVYFSLSSLNSISSINHAQILVVNQNSNYTALSSSVWSNGIKIDLIKTDLSITTDEKYYIEIKTSDLQATEFELNQYYKVQIRFSSIAPDSFTNPSASFFANNLDSFSEWSKVCLIKGIPSPLFEITNLNISETTIFASIFLNFICNYSCDDKEETLKAYQLKLYESTDLENPIADSGLVYAGSYDNITSFVYEFERILEYGKSYSISYKIITKNLYESIKTYSITIAQSPVIDFNASINIEENSEDGLLKLNISFLNEMSVLTSFFGNVIIKRGNSKDNFSIWEDVCILNVQGTETVSYEDLTIESGIFYKYSVQKISVLGERSSAIFSLDVKMVIFEHCYLLNKDKQLKIKFNPSISSLKNTVSESKTETIGSTFPIIRRNSSVNYREFPIGGLISQFSDENGLFISKEELFGGSSNLTLYQDYNSVNNINDYNDIVFEKLFRDEVVKFLYSNSIKLFKSSTEGNILVKIMDISLQPETVLGRMIYSFSGTAVEVAAANTDNYLTYDIISTGSYETIIESSENKIGQINQTFLANQEIFSLIQEQESNGTLIDNTIVTVEKLEYIKITIAANQHYPILDTGTSLTKVSGDSYSIIGTIVYINNEPIVVTGTEYLIGSNEEPTDIQSIYFPYQTIANIDYLCLKQTAYNESNPTASAFVLNNIFGQLFNSFVYEENLIDTISWKVQNELFSFKDKLEIISKIQIKTNENTIVYLKNNTDITSQKVLIDNTEMLELEDAVGFKEINFFGVFLNTNEYTEDLTAYTSFAGIISPIEKTIYKVNNIKYFFMNGAYNPYYIVSGGVEVKTKSNASLDYFGIVRGEVK